MVNALLAEARYNFEARLIDSVETRRDYYYNSHLLKCPFNYFLNGALSNSSFYLTSLVQKEHVVRKACLR